MTPPARRLLEALLFVLCLALLVWMVVQAGPSQLWLTLRSMPGTIALCCLVWGVGYLLNAASFREVLQGKEGGLTYLQVLRLTISGYALNYITPFGLLGGEPYRVWVLRRTISTERATQGVVLYSMMHVASHFCFWLLAGLLAIVSPLGVSRGMPMPYALLVTVVTILMLLLFWRLYRRGIALRFMRRWVDWPLLNPSLLPSGRFVRALGLELLSRLVNVVEYWVVMQALGFTTFGYAEALLTVAFSSLLANVLFFSPLQMGTREGGILLALQYLLPDGQLLPVALTLSFATRIREFLWIAIGLVLMHRK